MDFPHNIHTVQAPTPAIPFFNLLLLLILLALTMPLTHRRTRTEEDIFDDHNVEAVASALPQEFSAYTRYLKLKHDEKVLQQNATNSFRLYSLAAILVVTSVVSVIVYIYHSFHNPRFIPQPPNLRGYPIAAVH